MPSIRRFLPQCKGRGFVLGYVFALRGAVRGHRHELGDRKGTSSLVAGYGLLAAGFVSSDHHNIMGGMPRVLPLTALSVGADALHLQTEFQTRL